MDSVTGLFSGLSGGVGGDKSLFGVSDLAACPPSLDFCGIKPLVCDGKSIKPDRGLFSPLSSHNIMGQGLTKTPKPSKLLFSPRRSLKGVRPEIPVRNSGGHVHEDTRALRESCDQVVTMVETFNSRFPNLDSNARGIISDMNLRLTGILSPSVVGRADSSVDSAACEGKLGFGSLPLGEVNGVSVPQSSSTMIPQVSSPTAVSVDHLVGLLSKFDTRTVPRPENFDAVGGDDFSDFLACFEEYCSNTYRGSSTLWVGELGRFLTGEISDAFVALRNSCDSYDEIKIKLKRWVAESREFQIAGLKSNFSNAQCQPGESMRLFAARLEKMFRSAYPRKRVETSRRLKEKFSHSVPESFRQQLFTMRNMGLSMQGTEITWTNVLTLASAYDTRPNVPLVREAPVHEPVVWMNTSARYSDAVTQCDMDYRGPASSQELGASRSSGFTVPMSGGMVRKTNRLAPNSQPGGVAQDRVCFHCHKSGHLRENCRRLNNLCLACGSSEHHLGECPQRKNLMTSFSNVLSQPGFRSTQLPSFKTLPDISVPPPGYYDEAQSRFDRHLN